jgi:hypothetical protein
MKDAQSCRILSPDSAFPNPIGLVHFGKRNPCSMSRGFSVLEA